jgi:peptidoglycan/LPS O-acetylase OafA/YrhL
MKSNIYIPAISGLRAIGILAVLLYHISPGILPGGFGGVDLFFVISGFVVSLAMQKHSDQKFLEFMVYFYRKRIVRIMPALVVFVLFALLFSNIVFPRSFLITNSNKTGLLSFFGVSNVFLWLNANDYFVQNVKYNFFVHTWSLGVELQFYFIYPLMLYFIISNRSSSSRRLGFLVFLFLMGAAAFAANAWLGVTHESFSFYMIATRFWELAAGALLYHVPSREYRVQNRTGWNVFLVLMLILTFGLPKFTDVPFHVSVLSVITAVLLIHTIVYSKNEFLLAILASRPLVFIGNISYSLYLWHWFFIVLSHWLLGVDAGLAIVPFVIASVVFATVSYYAVEKPASQFFSSRFRRNYLFFIVSSVLILCFVATGYLISTRLSELKISVTNDLKVWYPYVVDSYKPGDTVCKVKAEYGERLFGHYMEFSPDECSLSAKGSIFVIGDSHADAYSRMLYYVSGNDNRKVKLYWSSGCTPFRFANYGETDTEACLAFIRSLVAELSRVATADDVLFLPALRVRRYRDQGEEEILETVDVPDEAKTLAIDIANLNARIADLAPLIHRDVTVVLDEPKPVFRSANFMCADWYMQGSRYCAEQKDILRSEQELRARHGRQIIRRAADLLPKAVIWDAFSVLCPDTKCSSYMDGKPLVFDGDHLTGYANDLLLPSFLNLINTLKLSDLF